MIRRKHIPKKIEQFKQWILSFVRTRYVVAKHTVDGITKDSKYPVLDTEYHSNGVVKTLRIIDDNKEHSSWMKDAFNGF